MSGNPTEYKILKKLISNKGQLLTYAVLLDSLWNDGVQLLDKHALAVNINRLRKKLEQMGILIFQMFMEWDTYGNDSLRDYSIARCTNCLFYMEKLSIKTRYL